MSWGTKIALSYIAFVVATIGIVLFSMTKEVDLVTDNYYEKELVYQEQIDKMTRANALTEKVSIKKEGAELKFIFPREFNYYSIEGEIHLYRPADSKKDIVFPVQIDSTYTQIISTNKLEKGMWKLNLDWNVNKISYFNEFRVMID